MRIVLLLGAAALTLPTFALAEDAPKPSEPRKICRTLEPPTGSHRPGKRICRTAAEWKAFDQGNADFQQDASGKPISATNEGGR